MPGFIKLLNKVDDLVLVLLLVAWGCVLVSGRLIFLTKGFHDAMPKTNHFIVRRRVHS